MTLTAAATVTKRFILIFGILSFVGTLSLIGISLWNAYQLSKIPPPEEKADIKFGILPLPNFPASKVSSSNFSYSVDTVTGNFPNFDKLAKVFFIARPQASFLAPEKSNKLAEKMGFTSQPQVISPTEYQFKQDSSELTVQLDSGNFKYASDSTESANPVTVNSDTLADNFKKILEDLSLLPDPLKNGPTKFATSQISIWPSDIDQKPIVTENPNTSLVYAKASGSGNLVSNYYSINYTFWPVDEEVFAKYPIKNVSLAFDDLKNGKGIVILEPSKPQVSITTVYLAYFLSESYSPYLQPIFVFEGPSFIAYVPAITEEFSQTK